MIAVLDTGAVWALAPTNERNRARLRALRQRIDDLTLPAAVLAEGLLTGHPGRDHHTRRLLDLVAVCDVGADLGFAAGALRTQVMKSDPSSQPSGVDALVVALADQRAANGEVLIITSDLDDIESLAVFTTNTRRLAVRST